MTALFRRISIRRKQVLIIMLTTTVALLLACSALCFTTLSISALNSWNASEALRK